MSWIHRAAALSGVSAVAMGAVGAHAFKPQNPAYADVFATANKYHLAHSALLAAAPLAARPTPVAAAAAAGTALFCGSCYAVAFAEDRAWGKAAPVGGFLLIGAWAALALPL